MKIEGSGSESGFISQRHGSADPDPPKMAWIRIRNTGETVRTLDSRMDKKLFR
jgi:hypothetical protein